jgi:predicted RNA-binding protein with PUA domain
MTVRELIEALKAIPNQDRIVVMSKDGEGNGFSPLADIGEESYAAESTWHGTTGIEALTPELEERGFSEEDVVKGEPCLTLWPTN